MAHILVADDEADITVLLREYLTSKGHQVSVVFDGYQLSEQTGTLRPQLIIADIKMPGAYGSTAYQVLQRDNATKDIPVIFISAHTLEEVSKILPKDPKTRFMHKPIDLKQLDAVIAELLPKRSARK